jgi:hypothetical protein
MLPTLFRAFIVWFAILLLAIVNGALREKILNPRLGETSGHIASTLILSILVVIITWLSISWIGPASLREAIIVGSVWLVLTLAFEFLAGHYLFGTSWDKLLADYDLSRARIWPLVLLTTLVSPPVIFWLKRGS